MRQLLAFSFAVLFAAVGSVALAGELESGLQVGESAGPYNVNDVTGPNKGDSLCYR